MPSHAVERDFLINAIIRPKRENEKKRENETEKRVLLRLGVFAVRRHRKSNYRLEPSVFGTTR